MQPGRYDILHELGAKSVLAGDAGGRPVVLKALPADCLLEGQLHPSISERLRRVREIAMTDVANLRGVERRDDRNFLIWDFVEGIRFEDDSQHDPSWLARELIHTVQRFHSTGLVHGALHSGNVLIDPNGRIRLIDVSPLLFLDSKRDEQAVLEMCRKLVNQRPDARLAAAVVEASASDMPMQLLAAKLSESASDVPPKPPRKVSIRRRTLLAALITVLVGIGLAVAIDGLVGRTHPSPLTPPRLSR